MAADAPFLGRGWSFPPSFTDGGADVEMVAGSEDVRQSLEILLGTVPGERVMQDDFGCDLHSQLFEDIDQGLVNTIERLVSDAILHHEPRLDLDRLEVEQSDSDPAFITINVSYTIRGTNSRFNLVFPFYVKEATQPGL